MTTAPAARPARRVEGLVPERVVLGTTLFAIATIMALGFVFDGVDRWTLLGVSLVTLIAFAFTREYGYAIPAGITGGLGIGVVLITSGTIAAASTGAAFFLPLAAGFGVVWLLGLISHPRETHPWPLVPAAILGSLGTAVALGQPGALDWIGIAVAIGLAATGISLLVRGDRAH